VRGWLAGDTDGLASWRWAWSKWAFMGAAQWLSLHGGRGRQAAAAGKITAASTVGFDWGRFSLIKDYSHESRCLSKCITIV